MTRRLLKVMSKFLMVVVASRNNRGTINYYRQVLKFNLVRFESNELFFQKAIEQNRNSGDFLLKQAIVEFIYELGNEASRSKTPN